MFCENNSTVLSKVTGAVLPLLSPGRSCMFPVCDSLSVYVCRARARDSWKRACGVIEGGSGLVGE